MTFSIAARCERTGMFGIAVSSSSPCVAARCAHVRAGVGAVATQNITDPSLGPKALDLLASGLSANEAMAALRSHAHHAEYRQLALIDRNGRTAAWSGGKTLGLHLAVAGASAVAAGNLLANEDVPKAMIEAFESSPDAHIGDRLIRAMAAAVEAGGEAGPVHSAGMLIADKVSWPIADLRIDWHDTDPIGALAGLWMLWKPQASDYVTRALDPSTAPSYGVPGDL